MDYLHGKNIDGKFIFSLDPEKLWSTSTSQVAFATRASFTVGQAAGACYYPTPSVVMICQSETSRMRTCSK
jgi:hypothetical protein